MVQVNIRLSDVAAQKLKDLAAQSGLALGVLIEKMMECYHPASTLLSPDSGDAITRLSGVVADLEARIDAVEARLSAMPLEAEGTALEPVLLPGKGEVVGHAEDALDQSGSRETTAQKRSLGDVSDDEFDTVVARYRRETTSRTGEAMRDAGYSFAQKRLVASLSRLNAK